jgi:hypothetical protein
MSAEAMPIAVKESPRSNYKFVTYVYHLVECLTGDASFASVSPSAPALKLAADGFAQAQAAARGGGPGLVAARDAQRLDLEAMLDALVISVRGIIKAAGADAPTAAAMILSTGLSIRKARVVNKPPLAARHGDVSGSVRLAARAVAKMAAYYWSWSTDMAHWTSAPETFAAKTTISGLTPGQVYYFRFQAKTRRGMGDYSDAVRLMVI